MKFSPPVPHLCYESLINAPFSCFIYMNWKFPEWERSPWRSCKSIKRLRTAAPPVIGRPHLLFHGRYRCWLAPGSCQCLIQAEEVKGHVSTFTFHPEKWRSLCGGWWERSVKRTKSGRQHDRSCGEKRRKRNTLEMEVREGQMEVGRRKEVMWESYGWSWAGEVWLRRMLRKSWASF